MSRVLVVEDDEAMAVALRDGFTYEGHEVIVARDGEAGLTRAREDSPDIMILDVMLPKMTGLEVCKLLRGEGSHAADHHAHRPRPGDRQGARSQARCRRLCDQTIQLHGAHGPGRGRAAALSAGR